MAASAATTAPDASRAAWQALAASTPLGTDKLPALRGVIDRLAPMLAEDLQTATTLVADVTTGPARALRFADIVPRLAPRTLLIVLRAEPWKTRIFAAIDAPVIAAAVHTLLGGARDAPAHATERPWTAIERRLAERFAADVVASALARAFAPVTPVQFAMEQLTDVPSASPVARPETGVIATRCTIAFANDEGHVDILLPGAALEPVAGELARDASERRRTEDPVWRAHLHELLPQITVPLRAVIEDRFVSAAEVIGWRPGSRLLLDRRHDEPIEVLCNTRLLFRARMAEKAGRVALHVDERRLAEDWPS